MTGAGAAVIMVSGPLETTGAEERFFVDFFFDDEDFFFVEAGFADDFTGAVPLTELPVSAPPVDTADPVVSDDETGGREASLPLLSVGVVAGGSASV